MTVKAAASAWRLDLQPLTKLVALALADEASDDIDMFHADVEHMATKTGLAVFEIFEGLDELVAAGHVERLGLFKFQWLDE